MYDIIYRKEIIATVDTYEEAWAIADKYPHAIVRWFEEVK